MGSDAIIERLRSRTVIDPQSGCWNWTGTITRGYGSISVNGRSWRVHRLAYTLLVDPDLPDNLVIDHVLNRGCTSKACWNPAHLEAVTQRENIIRGRLVLDAIARTHCDEGHELLSVKERAGIKQCATCRTMTTKCPKCGSIVLARHLDRHQERPVCDERAARRQQGETIECPDCGTVLGLRSLSRHRTSLRCTRRQSVEFKAVSDGC